MYDKPQNKQLPLNKVRHIIPSLPGSKPAMDHKGCN